MNNNEISWFVKLAISVVIMLAAAGVFMIIVKWMRFSSLDINDMMVSFVGILATFIVINNYAQIQEIKKDLERKIEDLKTQQTTIEEERKADEKFIRLWNKASLHSDSVTIASRLYNDANGEFSIVIADTPYKAGKSVKAKWRISDVGCLEFYTEDKPSEKIEHIMMVDECEFRQEYVECLLKSFIGLSRKVNEG
ncbi:MAG: hypothetical protein II453_19010 [Alphaproteobacteria bacterium]|nr:hypothetical protein [Alphaproteobacteria bacterium]